MFETYNLKITHTETMQKFCENVPNGAVIIYDWGWSQRENSRVTEKNGNSKVDMKKCFMLKGWCSFLKHILYRVILAAFILKS